MAIKKTEAKMLIIILGAILSCSACSRNELNKSHSQNLVTISVPLPVESGTTEDHFSKIEFIALESNAQSMIGDIERIWVYDNSLYIFDRQLKQILRFTDQGQFVAKIGNKGNGPGEYSSIRDFAIDEENGNVFLLCDSPFKLLIVDKQGQFKKEIPLTDLYKHIKIVEGAIVVFHDNDSHYAVYLNSETGEEMTKGAERSALSAKYPFRGGGFPITITSQSTHFCAYFDNLVYQIMQDGIYPRYLLDFMEKNIPEGIANIELPDSEVYQHFRENEWGFAVSNLHEHNDNLFFTYGATNHIAFYNNGTGVCKTYKGTLYDDNSKVFLSSFFAPDGKSNYVVNIINPVIMQRGLEYLKDNTNNDDLKFILQNLSINDNPIIAKCYYK
jgi:hypothetical protein